MKKSIIIAVLLLSCASVYGENIDYMFTDDAPNGRFITDENMNQNLKDMYLGGMLDMLIAVRPDIVNSFYPKCNRRDVIDAVIKYYQDNPTQRNRSVVEVVLSGCK